jgi:hypothetical protein
LGLGFGLDTAEEAADVVLGGVEHSAGRVARDAFLGLGSNITKTNLKISYFLTK